MKRDFWKTIQEIAKKCGVEDANYYVWKNRKSIPHKWHRQLIECANSKNIQLTYDELENPPNAN